MIEGAATTTKKSSKEKYTDTDKKHTKKQKEMRRNGKKWEEMRRNGKKLEIMGRNGGDSF